MLVRGHGVSHGELVRFHEKDAIGGKDVRVWHISAAARRLRRGVRRRLLTGTG